MPLKHINANYKILIVEDSEIQSIILKKIIEADGYNVITASDGLLGIEAAVKHKPDLIISDINMPSMDGYEMCLKIKTNPILKDIPIILLTQLSDTRDIVKGINSRADSYISKPYNKKHLLTRVFSLISDKNKQTIHIGDNGLEMTIDDEQHNITNDMKQIFGFLVTTFENAMHQNRELTKTQDELSRLNEELEAKVLQRTKELKDSQEQLLTLMQTVPDIIYRVDDKGIFTYLNPAIIKLGFKPEELIGRHFSTIIHPDDIKNISREAVLVDYTGIATGEGNAPKLFDERRTKRPTTELQIRLLPKASLNAGLPPDNYYKHFEINSSGILEFNIKTNGHDIVGTLGVIKEKSIILNGSAGVIRDISNRWKFEEKLKFITQAVEEAIDCIQIIDLEGIITYSNKAASKVYGYSPDEMQGKDINSLLIVPQFCKNVIIPAIKMDGRWVGELMIMDDKGASFPVLFSSSIVKDKDGEAIAIIAIIRDLTQSKAMIEALSDSENRFRKIFEDGPIAMAFSDYNNGKFIKVNKSFHDMLQYSELELFNMTFKDITYPDDLENNIENINKLRTKEISIYKTEKRYIKKNKDIMRGLLTLSVTYDNLGEPEYFLPMIEDITERKEADELKQRHLQVQAIINTILELSLKPMTMSSLLDGILGIILSIHWLALQSKGCILLVEDDFEKLKLVAQRNLHINLLNHCAIVPFGYCLCGKAAATKKIIFTDKIDQDHDHHYEGMTEHGHYIIPILSGDTVLGVLNLYVKEGHKWEQWEENFLISVANTMAGIIDRKHIEDQLRHYSEELNKSNEELKTFTYIVSHDLRAPLVNLKGFSYELKESVNEILPLLSQFKESIDPVQYERYRLAFEEDIPESLNFIEASSTKIDHMMNAILKLSRLGRSQLEMEQIDVNELVHFTINSLSHQIETKGVEITCGKLPKITGDRVSIEQIFGNLLDNALKYLDPNRKGKIKITGEIKGASAVFHFKDNGIGIAEGDFDKVFAIFRRIGISKEPGEGMGLAYTKALITKHNGNIWCESTLGKGTTFSFTIPL